MADMNDSQIEWIGDIPASWKIGKIKYFYKFQTGFTPDTTRSDYYDDENGYTWVSIADLDDRSRVINDSKAKISEHYIKEKRPEIIKKGSLLYSFKLSVGKKNFAGKDLYTNEAIGSFIEDKTVNLNFLYYASFLIEKNANINIYGAKLLNSTLINNSYTVFPPLREQKAIADFLDSEVGKINGIISNIEKQIEILEGYRKALITETVTKGLDKDVQYKETGIDWIGKIPLNWTVSKLKYHSEIYSGEAVSSNDYQDEGFPIMGANGVLGYYNKINIDKMVITTGRVGTIGTFYLVDNCWATDNVLIIESSEVELIYLYCFMQIVDVESLSTTTAQPLITATKLKNISLLVPTKEEQRVIGKYIHEKTSNINKLIEKKREQIFILAETKNSLIYEYVTGKKRVGGFNNDN